MPRSERGWGSSLLAPLSGTVSACPTGPASRTRPGARPRWRGRHRAPPVRGQTWWRGRRWWKSKHGGWVRAAGGQGCGRVALYDALSRESLRRETAFCRTAAVCQHDSPKTRGPGSPSSEGDRRFSESKYFHQCPLINQEIAVSCGNVLQRTVPTTTSPALLLCVVLMHGINKVIMFLLNLLLSNV